MVSPTAEISEITIKPFFMILEKRPAILLCTSTFKHDSFYLKFNSQFNEVIPSV